MVVEVVNWGDGGSGGGWGSGGGGGGGKGEGGGEGKGEGGGGGKGEGGGEGKGEGGGGGKGEGGGGGGVWNAGQHWTAFLSSYTWTSGIFRLFGKPTETLSASVQGRVDGECTQIPVHQRETSSFGL